MTAPLQRWRALAIISSLTLLVSHWRGPSEGPEVWPATVVASDHHLQDAIDSLGGKPGTIVVPPGKYSLNRGLQLSSGQRLVGSGATQGGTILQYLPPSGSSELIGNYAIRLAAPSGELVSRAEVRDLVISGSPGTGLRRARRRRPVAPRRGLPDRERSDRELLPRRLHQDGEYVPKRREPGRQRPRLRRQASICGTSPSTTRSAGAASPTATRTC